VSLARATTIAAFSLTSRPVHWQFKAAAPMLGSLVDECTNSFSHVR
jgi:hypothetical protein